MSQAIYSGLLRYRSPLANSADPAAHTECIVQVISETEDVVKDALVKLSDHSHKNDGAFEKIVDVMPMLHDDLNH